MLPAQLIHMECALVDGMIPGEAGVIDQTERPVFDVEYDGKVSAGRDSIHKFVVPYVAEGTNLELGEYTALFTEKNLTMSLMTVSLTTLEDICGRLVFARRAKLQRANMLFQMTAVGRELIRGDSRIC